jgi:aminoacyl tRNA synthase complex-interacting multifunctional protein 1
MAVGGGNTSSHAALCFVQVSESKLQKDWVLHMVLMYLQKVTHQVSIQMEKKDNVLSMKMGGGCASVESTSAITQRNAILRSLSGMALHGAMDLHYRNEIALCWNGGYSSTQASRHGTSVNAAIQSAAILHYMTLASNLRQNPCDTSMLDAVVGELNQTLEQSSFLVPLSATATLADMDVCLALLSLEEKSFADFPVHVKRWMIHLLHVLEQLATFTNVPLPAALQKTNDAIQSFLASKAPAPPLFFDGTEDVTAVLTQLSAATSGSSTNAAKGSKRVEPAKEMVANNGERTVQKAEQQGTGKAKLTKQEKKAASKTDGGKEKKNEEPVASEAPMDVMALDIRVGKIVKIWPHESADKLYCEEIDLGNGEIRQIASGLRPFYTDVNDLKDQMVLVLCNLKKRTLVGFPSHGMVLCASNAEHTSVELVVPPPDATIGERIVFDGLDAHREPEPETKVAKKKIFEGIAPDLRTDADGYVAWKTHRAQSSVGPVRAIKQMPNASVS